MSRSYHCRSFRSYYGAHSNHDLGIGPSEELRKSDSPNPKTQTTLANPNPKHKPSLNPRPQKP